MDLGKYQVEIAKFDQVPEENKRMYYATGLAAEAGELIGRFAKILRGDEVTDTSFEDEAGDVLWFVARICTYYGWSLSLAAHYGDSQTSLSRMRFTLMPTIARINHVMGLAWFYNTDETEDLFPMLQTVLGHLKNISSLEWLAEVNYRKLHDRYERGVIQGDGDKR